MFSSSHGMAPGQIPQDLVNQLSSTDEAVRLEATQSLGMLPDSQCLLIQMLGDESWRVRQAAVTSLAHYSEPAIAPLLLDLLRQHHHNPGVVDSVLRILRLSSLNATTLWLECATDADADLRIYAMTALGEQHNLPAFQGLMQGLSDVDVNVRYHAIESLGRHRNIAAVEALMAIAEAHEAFLAFPALDALARIGDTSVVPRLLLLLNDDILALPTLEALAILGDITTIAKLAALFEQPHVPAPVVAKAIAQIYQTAIATGSADVPLADMITACVPAVVAQKLTLMVTQFTPPGVKSDSIEEVTFESGSLVQPVNTEAIP